MAPKSPWKKAPITSDIARNVALESTFAANDYGEVQSDEIEALKAIFMDDFEDLPIKGAWAKTADRGYRLTLRSFSDPESFVVFTVRYTATYPKTVPLLEVERLNAYHKRTTQRIDGIVRERPTQLLGEPMIYAIASDIQEAIEDAVLAREQGTLPSLEDERANAEENATALAREAAESEERRQREAKEEEDRMLKHMVAEEINRVGKRKPLILPTDIVDMKADKEILDSLAFDQAGDLQVQGQTVRFHQLSIVSTMLQSQSQQAYLARPKILGSSSVPLVIVKRVSISSDRAQVVELEDTLQTVKNLRNGSILRLLAFRIDKIGEDESALVACSELGDRGSLYELLELGPLHADKGRQFSIQLLEALDYIHSNGVAHGHLCVRSVAVDSRPALSLKLEDIGLPLMSSLSDMPSRKWRAPESDNVISAGKRKVDIWMLGIVLAQMFLGRDIDTRYSSPHLLLDKVNLTDSFDDLLRKCFTSESKKRPSAFDLLPSEYLRSEDPVMAGAAATHVRDSRPSLSRSSNDATSLSYRGSRPDVPNINEPISRYVTDFTEIGRLGKGGFGEVVKARNKLDGGVYAVKKIKQASKFLDQVIQEVMLLNRLNHPYVVRYFSTWVEDDASGITFEDSSNTTDTTTETETATDVTFSDAPRIDFGFQSTSGLDFVSSSGYPQIEFGEDSDEENSGGSQEDDINARQTDKEIGAPASGTRSSLHGDLELRVSRSDSRRAPSTLYIQMEYCERQTLRDLIRKAMTTDESWRYMRQITEGLAHIHSHGIIHRDLKPDNVFIDRVGDPRIGDFGLATTSQHQLHDRAVTTSGHSAGELTRSVGTALYVAPELRSSSGASYNDKVDMYSLGIMFFEMCEFFNTAMERIKALQRIRERAFSLPNGFQVHGDRAAQGRLITCLMSHKPSERPSSTELLRNDILPMKIEDETIRLALSGLSDPRSPYHQKLMSALFSGESAEDKRVKALAWDARGVTFVDDSERLRLRDVAKKTLENVFRRHGAEEARRPVLFPVSGYYTDPRVVRVLDASGNLLQLPYDLTLPNARQLANQPSNVRCTYAFGNAYRDQFNSGSPRVSEEVDFDIADGISDDRRFSDAEILKVMDEVACEMPLFPPNSTISLHVNHSDILNVVLEFCRIPVAQHPAIKDIISKLGFHQHTWSKVRSELRRFGLSDTTLEDLQQFDFCEPPEMAFARIGGVLDGASANLKHKMDSGMQTLSAILAIARSLNVQRKINVTPLGSVNAKFYEGGMLLQCVLEKKSTRLVVAAGGRYDNLVLAHRSVDARIKPQGAVGIAIGLDPIISHMQRGDTAPRRSFMKETPHIEDTPKRCDIALIDGGTEAVRDVTLKILSSLWANNIRAELVDAKRPSKREHSFTVTLKHEASNTVRVADVGKDGQGDDISIQGLISYLQQELRGRENAKNKPPSLLRQASQPEGERKSNVQVLMARHGSKKSNKYQIVTDAQQGWCHRLDELKDAPILAVETRDEILAWIRDGTRLSDPDSWRKVVQRVQLNDRQYVQQLHDVLSGWRRDYEEQGGMREACLFNFRTQYCVYYDLGV